jgi:ribonuclease Z
MPQIDSTKAEVAESPMNGSSEGNPYKSARVITLGTGTNLCFIINVGSAIPSNYRNVSSTLVMMPSTEAYLMDCGEDTIGQIHRMYGYDGADRIVFAKLKLIFVSHLHADHHLGFISLAQRWLEVTPESAKLVVLAPAEFLDWINEYQSFETIDWRSRIEFYNSDQFDSKLIERTRCVNQF